MIEFTADNNCQLLNDRIIDVAKQRLFSNTGQCGISITINNS